jgi:hypothetical protein
MSDHLAARVLRTPMPATDKVILGLLATYADGDGSRCFPGVKRLAAESGLHKRSVQLTLRRLEAAGRIEQTARARQHRPAEYRIVLERLAVISRGGATATPEKAARGGVTTTPGPIPLQRRVVSAMVSAAAPGVASDASRGGVSCAPGVKPAPPDSVTDSKTDSRSASTASDGAVVATTPPRARPPDVEFYDGQFYHVEPWLSEWESRYRGVDIRAAIERVGLYYLEHPWLPVHHPRAVLEQSLRREFQQQQEDAQLERQRQQQEAAPTWTPKKRGKRKPQTAAQRRAARLRRKLLDLVSYSNNAPLRGKEAEYAAVVRELAELET